MRKNAISARLRQKLLGLLGLGSSSIKNMRQFFETWAAYLNRQSSVNGYADRDVECFFSVGFTLVPLMNGVKAILQNPARAVADKKTGAGK